MKENRVEVILDKKYTNRNKMKKDLVKYMLGIWETGAVGILVNQLEEEKQTFVEDIAEALIEDAEVSDYTRCIWDEYTFDCEGQNDKCEMICMKQNKSKFPNIDGMIDMIDAVVSKIGSQSSGLNVYTFRYPILYKKVNKGNKEKNENTIDTDKLIEVLCDILNDMNKQINNELYQQAYPVFWLEALNMQFSRRRKKQVCFKQPIEQGSDQEKYLFSLLLDIRVSDIKDSIIFPGVKRKFKSYMDSFLNVNESLNRWIYVKLLRDKMGREIQKTQNEKEEIFKEQLKKRSGKNVVKKEMYNSTTIQYEAIFKNNIVTLRELISIGRKNGLNDINKAVSIFLLERLTGWVEFYNYVRMEEGIEEGRRKWISQESCLGVFSFFTKLGECELKEQLKQNAMKAIEGLLQGKDNGGINIEDIKKSFSNQPEGDILNAETEMKEMREYFQDRKNKSRCENAEDETEKNMGKQVDDFEEAYFKYMDKCHIATFYCISRWMEKNDVVSRWHNIVFEKDFFASISELLNIVSEKINWEQKAEIQPESKWYDLLYDELFIDDIEKVRRATKFEAANFYDTWRN